MNMRVLNDFILFILLFILMCSLEIFVSLIALHWFHVSSAAAILFNIIILPSFILVAMDPSSRFLFSCPFHSSILLIFMDFSSLFIYCYTYIPFIDCTSFSVPMSRCFSYRHTKLNRTTTKNRIFLSFEITEHQISTSKRKFNPYMWVCYTDKHLLIGLWLIFEYEKTEFLSVDRGTMAMTKEIRDFAILVLHFDNHMLQKCHSFSAFKKRIKKTHTNCAIQFQFDKLVLPIHCNEIIKFCFMLLSIHFASKKKNIQFYLYSWR